MDDDSQTPRAVTRRRLLGAGAQVTGAVAVAAFTLPALAFVVGPAFESGPEHWEAVGAPADFTSDAFRPRVITLDARAGEAGKGLVYVRRRTDVDRDTTDEFVAVTSRCSHVGCPVKYVQAAQSFVCPCHGGVYGFRGERTGGPPPRPLDRFRTRVRAGRLEIGPRFSLDNRLRPHAPHHPGESLDGASRLLYP